MQSPVNKLTDTELEALKFGNSAVWRLARQETARMGRTSATTSQQKNNNISTRSQRDNLLKHAREVITTIIENSDIIVLGTNSTKLEEAFQKLEQDLERRRSVESVFNLPFDMLKDLFDRGIVPRDYVELRVDR
jgi:ketopantoate reductase